MQTMYITFRKKDRGGGVVDESPENGEAYWPRSRFIWLVHGFNVSRREGEATFKEFEATLKEFEDNLRGFSATLTRDVCQVYWPGDGWMPYFRALMYPWRIDPAIASGQLFGRYVCKLGAPPGMGCEYIIIAHSLGCRLALEALRELAAVQVKARVILMAAAVPVDMLRPLQPLRDALESAAPRRAVLYSDSDKVLELAFPPGQAIGGEGFSSEAVGLRGYPMGLWTDWQYMQGFGHGDYWPNTAGIIARLLGAGGVWAVAGRQAAPPRPMLRRQWPGMR